MVAPGVAVVAAGMGTLLNVVTGMGMAQRLMGIWGEHVAKRLATARRELQQVEQLLADLRRQLDISTAELARCRDKRRGVIAIGIACSVVLARYAPGLLLAQVVAAGGVCLLAWQMSSQLDERRKMVEKLGGLVEQQQVIAKHTAATVASCHTQMKRLGSLNGSTENI